MLWLFDPFLPHHNIKFGPDKVPHFELVIRSWNAADAKEEKKNASTNYSKQLVNFDSLNQNHFHSILCIEIKLSVALCQTGVIEINILL